MVSREETLTKSRIVVACDKPDETCRIRHAMETIDNCDVAYPADEQALEQAFRQGSPDLVIAAEDSALFESLRRVRRLHQHVHFIIVHADEPVTFDVGVNICVAREDLQRVCPWVEILLSLKRGIGPNIGPAVKVLNEAVRSSEAHIYSPTIEELRAQARRQTMTAEERDTALRKWTREIEQKKQVQAHRTRSSPDPFIPLAKDENLEADSAEDATGALLAELKKFQSELVSQMSALKVEIQSLKTQQPKDPPSKS